MTRKIERPSENIITILKVNIILIHKWGSTLCPFVSVQFSRIESSCWAYNILAVHLDSTSKIDWTRLLKLDKMQLDLSERVKNGTYLGIFSGTGMK